jgi:hypothetical protein
MYVCVCVCVCVCVYIHVIRIYIYIQVEALSYMVPDNHSSPEEGQGDETFLFQKKEREKKASPRAGTPSRPSKEPVCICVCVHVCLYVYVYV